MEIQFLLSVSLALNVLFLWRIRKDHKKIASLKRQFKWTREYIDNFRDMLDKEYKEFMGRNIGQ